MSTGKRRLVPTETQLVKAILELLQRHPKVALAWRTNTGAAKFGERFVRFGYPGVSDIIGMLKNGKFIAIEVKTPRAAKKPSSGLTEAQSAFLKVVARSSGVAFVATSPVAVLRLLNEI